MACASAAQLWSDPLQKKTKQNKFISDFREAPSMNNSLEWRPKIALRSGLFLFFFLSHVQMPCFMHQHTSSPLYVRHFYIITKENKESLCPRHYRIFCPNNKPWKSHPWIHSVWCQINFFDLRFPMRFKVSAIYSKAAWNKDNKILRVASKEKFSQYSALCSIRIMGRYETRICEHQKV